MNNYKELEIELKDILDTDLVFGTDNKWHNIEVLETHIPKRMFKIIFSNGDIENYNIFGFIKCSGDHRWKVYDNINNRIGEFSTLELFYDPYYITYNIGTINGPMIFRIEEIDIEPVKCIKVLNSEDQQFLIILNKE